jgi:hypothetical protein
LHRLSISGANGKEKLLRVVKVRTFFPGVCVRVLSAAIA